MDKEEGLEKKKIEVERVRVARKTRGSVEMEDKEELEEGKDLEAERFTVEGTAGVISLPFFRFHTLRIYTIEYIHSGP